MNSMTGYGRGECARDGFKLTVEVSSVNRRQSDIMLSLPRELDPLDQLLRDAINRRVARGRVNVRIRLHVAEGGEAPAHLNTRLAESYARELKRLGEKLELAATLSVDTLVRLPGVVVSEDATAQAEIYRPAAEAALAAALTQLARMRQREGAHLLKALRGHIGAMRKLTRALRRRAPLVSRQYRAQLLQRLAAADLPEIRLDDERLVKEVALFADRSDISEELTRLESHFEQFEHYGQATEPVGRTLDFLAQEMNREVNTIGSKANDSVISQTVVELKAALEKFREQVQNVE